MNYPVRLATWFALSGSAGAISGATLVAPNSAKLTTTVKLEGKGNGDAVAVVTYMLKNVSATQLLCFPVPSIDCVNLYGNLGTGIIAPKGTPPKNGGSRLRGGRSDR